MLVPWFIAAARIDANHHFVSDVALSIAMVGAITWGLTPVARRRVAPS
jgi:membrane-associated phospholipid phosphatase